MPESKAATPVPAATVLLVRDAPELEVFMVVRHHQIDFASGALVFPGGKADVEDFDPEFRAFADSAPEDPTSLGLMVAAVREAYEECGVLLARPRGSDNLVSGTRLAEMESQRDELNANDVQFLDILKSADLLVACDLLVHYAHWVTPDMMPKRFDTHFYLAIAPSDQLAVHDGHESVDSVWITPKDVMKEAAEGTKTVIFPTMCNVEKLARFQSVDAAMAVTRTATVVRVLPWTERREDGNYICIPKEADYDVSEQKMPDRHPNRTDSTGFVIRAELIVRNCS